MQLVASSESAVVLALAWLVYFSAICVSLLVLYQYSSSCRETWQTCRVQVVPDIRRYARKPNERAMMAPEIRASQFTYTPSNSKDLPYLKISPRRRPTIPIPRDQSDTIQTLLASTLDISPFQSSTHSSCTVLDKDDDVASIRTYFNITPLSDRHDE